MATPSGPQYGVPYVLTGPDGTRAVFNDPTDPDYVGMLSNISGFDSPELRESADDLVEMDGGIHGDFWYGRRPFTMEGVIFGHASGAERNYRVVRLQQATNAMRGDLTLEWTPDGGVAQFITGRRQQPLRIEGPWNKTFQFAGVAADPRIYSQSLFTSQVDAGADDGTIGFGFDLSFDIDFGVAPVVGQIFATNDGNTETFPIYTFTGPGVSPAVQNVTTGKTIAMLYTLAAGEALVVDTLNRTVSLGTLTSDASGTVVDPATLVTKYSALDFTNTDWGGLVPGSNDLRLSYFSSSAGAKLRVTWRNAWL